MKQKTFLLATRWFWFSWRFYFASLMHIRTKREQTQKITGWRRYFVALCGCHAVLVYCSVSIIGVEKCETRNAIQSSRQVGRLPSAFAVHAFATDHGHLRIGRSACTALVKPLCISCVERDAPWTSLYVRTYDTTSDVLAL